MTAAVRASHRTIATAALAVGVLTAAGSAYVPGPRTSSPPPEHGAPFVASWTTPEPSPVSLAAIATPNSLLAAALRGPADATHADVFTAADAGGPPLVGQDASTGASLFFAPTLTTRSVAPSGDSSSAPLSTE